MPFFFRSNLFPILLGCCLRAVLFLSGMMGPEVGRLPGPHELPDFFVERGIAVLIRDDLATIEYRLGANPVTMSHQLRDWGVSEVPQNDQEITRLFFEIAQVELLKQVGVSIGESGVPLEIMEVRQGGQHHLTGVVVMTFPIEGLTGLKKVRVSDNSFLQFNGAVRVAFHTLGNVMTRSSRVAPALVRADRLELPKIEEIDQQEIVEIEVSVIFPGAMQGAPSSTGAGPNARTATLAQDWFVADEAPEVQNGSN